MDTSLALEYDEPSIVILEDFYDDKPVLCENDYAELTDLLGNRIPVRPAPDVGGPSPEQLAICLAFSDFVSAFILNGTYDVFKLFILKTWDKIRAKKQAATRAEGLTDSSPAYLDLSIHFPNGNEFTAKFCCSDDSDEVKETLIRETYDLLRDVSKLGQ